MNRTEDGVIVKDYKCPKCSFEDRFIYSGEPYNILDFMNKKPIDRWQPFTSQEPLCPNCLVRVIKKHVPMMTAL